MRALAGQRGIRILVTGTRGKSSVTRLLHAALSASGLRTYARITGVLPRQISPEGERIIRRSSPAHIREMKWWLAQIPASAEAIVAENSAIEGEFQAAAAAWLCPTLVVWTTLRPDHREAWGPGTSGAMKALFQGIPPGIPVACGAGLKQEELLRFFEANKNQIFFVEESRGKPDHHRENLALSRLALSICGRDTEEARKALALLGPDLADFRILRSGADELALAFSANDLESTRTLFEETGWAFQDTTALYHHRNDRPQRLRDFLPWLRGMPWKETVFTRPGAFSLPAGIPRADIHDQRSFEEWRKGRGRVFACGNVAGWPLEFLRAGGGL